MTTVSITEMATVAAVTSVTDGKRSAVTSVAAVADGAVSISVVHGLVFDDVVLGLVNLDDMVYGLDDLDDVMYGLFDNFSVVVVNMDRLDLVLYVSGTSVSVAVGAVTVMTTVNTVATVSMTHMTAVACMSYGMAGTTMNNSMSRSAVMDGMALGAMAKAMARSSMNDGMARTSVAHVAAAVTDMADVTSGLTEMVCTEIRSTLINEFGDSVAAGTSMTDVAAPVANMAAMAHVTTVVSTDHGLTIGSKECQSVTNRLIHRFSFLLFN